MLIYPLLPKVADKGQGYAGQQPLVADAGSANLR